MGFDKLKIAQQQHISNMLNSVTHLFEVDLDKDILWNTYLDSFPAGTNEMYRKRREYDCSCCRHFIKAFGNVVSIKNNKVTTIWDFEIDDSTFTPVLKALSSYVKSHIVSDLFITKENHFGTDKSFEDLKSDGKVCTWDHFFFKLPKEFITISSKSKGSLKGAFRDIRNVFKRSLEEITEEAVLTVLELIAQKSLYKGDEWEAVLKQFLKYHKEYNKLRVGDKENYCWEQSINVGPVIGKIRNHSIGTLLVDISEDVELDEAVRKYEAITAPTNYKRPKAVFTKKMLEDAQKKLEEMGLIDSLGRRFATLDDITVNNILFANRSAMSRINGSVFEDMKQELAVNPKSFEKVEEITIDKFISDVLPTAKNLEVLLENKHITNMVSLIAPKVKDCKTLFKWDNNFSWAYKGNITDSMKERVKSFGGKVDGVLRFSIQWNTEQDNDDDLDAHCNEPAGDHIYYGDARRHKSSGELDVDIRSPKSEIGNETAVENITWSDKSKMPNGTYKFHVHQFNARGAKSGFTAEIEFDGQIFSFAYNKPLRQGEVVPVADVMYDKKTGVFTLVEKLPSATSSRKVWNLDTNQFQPVSVLMFSPNYWNEQDGIGHKHYFFMLKNCVNDESPNGFFNEYLKEELMEQKRVFEALGSKMRVEDVEDQLSGVGFSSTKHTELVCKVEGTVSRVLKIKF
jgi:hypothetical protein